MGALYWCVNWHGEHTCCIVNHSTQARASEHVFNVPTIFCMATTKKCLGEIKDPIVWFDIARNWSDSKWKQYFWAVFSFL